MVPTVAIGITIAIVIVLVAVWVMLFKGPKDKGDRTPIPELRWDPTDVQKSLDTVLKNVEAAANSASKWYWDNKAPRARASRFIRASAVFLGALAGLVPVAIELSRSAMQTAQAVSLPWWVSGLWASILLGIVASLVSLDAAFGFSAGWARYVLAATDITRRLAEFRMEWIAGMAAIPPGSQPTSDQIATLLQKARDFRVGVESVVVQETKDWVSAFQNSLAQLEKELRTQMDALSAQNQTRLKEAEAANQPGSIEVTVPNADKAQDSTLFMTLMGSEGPVVTEEKLLHNKTWIRLNVRPGPYHLTVAATVKGDAAVRRAASTLIALKAGEQIKTTLSLPE